MISTFVDDILTINKYKTNLKRQHFVIIKDSVALMLKPIYFRNRCNGTD